MITTQLLHAVLRVEAVVTIAAVLVVFGHGVWLKVAGALTRPRRTRGRRALAELVNGGEEEQAASLAVLAKLPARARSALLEEATAGVRGGGTMTIADAAARLGLMRRAQRDCRSRRWSRRALGIHLLTIWGDSDVRAELLADRHPVVRARAIEWAGDHPTPELVDLVLDRLTDVSLLCRWTAEDAVLRAQATATAPLAHRLELATGPELEVLLSLAARRPSATFENVALRLLGDERPGVRAGAAEVLGALGGPEGTAGLQSLLADSEPGPRVAAAEGLGRLGHWPAAASVGALLADPSWDVRRAGAEALAGMGAPGALLLGHYARAGDGDAAEAARYAVDVAKLLRGRRIGAVESP